MFSLDRSIKSNQNICKRQKSKQNSLLHHFAPVNNKEPSGFEFPSVFCLSFSPFASKK